MSVHDQAKWLNWLVGFQILDGRSRFRHLTTSTRRGYLFGQMMRICRTILAALIAISVAMVPMAAGAFAKMADASMSDTPMSMTTDDGCMHHAKQRGDKTADDCAAMAACALKCFNFSQPVSATLAVPHVVMAAMSDRASPHVSSLQGLPPFRPPRS